MRRRRYSITLKNPTIVSVASTTNALALLGFIPTDQRTADFLSQVSIFGQRFQFVVSNCGWAKQLRLVCRCGRKVRKLVEIEGDWACRKQCQNVAETSRCRPRSGVVEARYLRPLRILSFYEERLALADTVRKRQIAEKKIARVRSALGEYMCDLHDSGQIPVAYPGYFAVLSLAL